MCFRKLKTIKAFDLISLIKIPTQLKSHGPIIHSHILRVLYGFILYLPIKFTVTLDLIAAQLTRPF